jgi:hypothetical protein
MGYERSKFGDGSAAGSGNVVTEVSNHFGPRDTGKTTGISNSDGFIRELTLDLDGAVATAGEFALTVVPKLPAQCRIEDVYLEVETAWALGGTTPVVDVGTEGSEATNGFTITEAQLEAVGVYDLTGALSGTWSAAGGLTAETVLGILLGGGTPTAVGGKARVVIRYFKA